MRIRRIAALAFACLVFSVAAPVTGRAAVASIDERTELDRIEALYAEERWEDGLVLSDPGRFDTSAGQIQARYLKALGLWRTGRASEAEPMLRNILSQYPDLSRVRMTLAALLASQGRATSARHNYAMLRGTLDDPDASAYLDRAIAELDAGKPWYAGLSLGILGSTNINAGIDADEVRIGSLVARPGPSNRRRSGPGLQLGASAGLRHELDAERAAVLRLDVTHRDYAGSVFDSTETTLAPGIRKAAGNGVIGLDAVLTGDWTRVDGAAADLSSLAAGPRIVYRGPIGRTWRLDMEASLLLREDRLASSRSGASIEASVEFQHALDPTASVILRSEVDALAAQGQAETYISVRQAAGLYRDWPGGWSTYGEINVGFRLHAGDFPFAGQPREDLSGGLRVRVARRDLSIFGFAPYLQVQYDRSASTVDLYDHDGFTVFNGWTQSF